MGVTPSIISTGSETLLVSAGGSGQVVLSTATPPAQIVSIAVQGPPGPQGPGGVAGVAQLSLAAGPVSISAFTAVAIQNGVLVPGDSANAALCWAIAGIATNSAQSGLNVSVQASGLITYNGWNWTLGSPVFVGSGGVLTQTPPTSGFAQVAGVPVSATELLIDLADPVLIA